MKNLFLCIATLFLAITIYAQPMLEWAAAFSAGGTGTDHASSIAKDDFGNYYTTGYFNGTAYFGGSPLVSNGSYDIYVMKLDSLGNILWTVSAGSTGIDYCNGIDVDSAGNCYIIGGFTNTIYFGDMPLGSLGGDDVFIAKLDTNGNWLWAKRTGGSGAAVDDYGYSILVDSNDLIYVIGCFSGTASFGNLLAPLTSSGLYDIFIAALNQSGTWIWATQAGGANYDIGMDLQTDSAGNLYITGFFTGSASFGGLPLTGSTRDIFVAKLNPGGAWLWVKKAGGNENDEGYGISIDNNGNCYITGIFKGTASFGALSLTAAGTTSGSNDIYIAKLDTNGNWLWAKRAGGDSSDYCYSIVSDLSGNIYLTGYFMGTASFGPLSLSSNGSYDIFVAKLDTNGNWLWSYGAGGTSVDYGQDMCLGNNETIYVTGSFMGTALFGDLSITGVNSSFTDIFIARLSYPAIPLSPQNLIITKSGNNMLLEWDPVTENTAGSSITPDYYEIYFHSNNPYAGLLPLFQTATESYTHIGAASAGQGFYFVKAVVLD